MIERVTDGDDFKYCYKASEERAEVFDPMVELTHLQWFRDYYPKTQCANGLGMDVIPPRIVERFIEIAAKSGKSHFATNNVMATP